MFSRKQILSAMAGVAMLALPVSAFAGHHDGDWNRPRPFARHDQGWHKGWEKHQWTRGGWYGTPAQRPFVNYPPPTSQRYGWNNNGYPRGCDRYGDRCGWQANAQGSAYQPYAPAYQGYATRSYGYPPVAAMGARGCNPAAVYSGSTPSQSPSWLMAKRQRTMATIAQLRARGDSRGAARLVPTVTALNRRIGGLNNQRGCSVAPMSSQANATSYNNGAYYNGSYATNPTVDALSTIAVPMLSGIR